MDRDFHYILLKSNSLFTVLLLWLLSYGNSGIKAQHLAITDSLSVPLFSTSSIDIQGNLYLATQRGKIIKISTDFKDKWVYSPDNPATINLLECRQGLRLFTFSEAQQTFTLLDRFLTRTESHRFSHPEISYVSIATLGNDNNVWLIDQASLKLMKWNFNLSTIEASNPLFQFLPGSMDAFTLFKTHQNKLYIKGKHTDILVFDNLGNYQKSIEQVNGEGIGFYGDFIYWLENEHVLLQNLYSQERKTVVLPEVEEPVQQVYFFENKLYLLTRGKIYRIA